MKRKIAFACFGLVTLSLLLPACSQAGKINRAVPSLASTFAFPTAQGAIPSTGQTVVPGATATAGQASDAIPLVIARDQGFSSGKVVVDQVVSSGPGWVVIQTQDPAGVPGKIIGSAAVKDGINNNVTVAVDMDQATPVMIAMLYRDAGKPGTFEYPGPDEPVLVNGQVALSVFHLEPGTASVIATPAGSLLQGLNQTATAIRSGAGSTPASGTLAETPTIVSNGVTPAVEVNDQAIQINQNGVVNVDQVVSDGPGWIAIYTVTNGQPDEAIGYTQVQAGEQKNVMVQIDFSKATPTLAAVLHIDAGQPGVFEFPGPDAAVVIGLRFASALFQNTTGGMTHAGGNNPPEPTPAPEVTGSPLPPRSEQVPSITVINQPIHNGTVIIPAAYSVGESWLVIHPQYPDGTLANYIGHALLHDGLNQNVLVRVDITRTKPSLVAMLHVNESKANFPQYPGVDAPLMVNGQMVAPGFQVQGEVTGDLLLTSVENSEKVPHLADAFGMSLYMNLNDQGGFSSCAGDCLGSFRPLTVSGKVGGGILAGDGVAIDKIGESILEDGTRLITYGGAPLYYNLGDKSPGDALGQGWDGIWFLVTP